MILEIDGAKIEVEVRVDKTFKAIKYELTSDSEIDPLDASFCLWLLVKNVCEEAGLSVHEFLHSYNTFVTDDAPDSKNLLH